MIMGERVTTENFNGWQMYFQLLVPFLGDMLVDVVVLQMAPEECRGSLKRPFLGGNF